MASPADSPAAPHLVERRPARDLQRRCFAVLLLVRARRHDRLGCDRVRRGAPDLPLAIALVSPRAGPTRIFAPTRSSSGVASPIGSGFAPAAPQFASLTASDATSHESEVAMSGPSLRARTGTLAALCVTLSLAACDREPLLTREAQAAEPTATAAPTAPDPLPAWNDGPVEAQHRRVRLARDQAEQPGLHPALGAHRHLRQRRDALVGATRGRARVHHRSREGARAAAPGVDEAGAVQIDPGGPPRGDRRERRARCARALGRDARGHDHRPVPDRS